MGLTLDFHDGQTLLDEDEKLGLLIKSIATRRDLDEFEQKNIEEAIQWSIVRSFKVPELFTEALLKAVHRNMFGSVWAWAGDFRTTNKNIGINHWLIALELKVVLDDAVFWIENKVFEPDEIVIRFKHRLVSVHCFPNGNGRHSRLMADIIIENVFKGPAFSWGARNLNKKTNAHQQYIKALREADKGNYGHLITFARS